MNSTLTRIGFLKCGDLKGKAYEKNGGYNEIYKHWIEASVPNPLVNKFTFDSYDVVQGIYPNEDQVYDCLILSGSGTTPASPIYPGLIQH